MADLRIYNLSDTLSSEDTSAYIVADKSGFSNAKKVLYSTLKSWFKVGDQQYTEENYATNDETLTASVDALDIALKDVSDQLSASVTNLFLAEVTLSAADILAGYSIPKEIIANPGANVGIDIISATCFLNYGTSDYVASTNKLLLRYDGESTGLFEWSNSFIESSSDTLHKGVISSNVVIKTNKKVEAFIENANPEAGDSTMKFYVLYRKITTS
jgi:hypothetical protein